jgi:hypothetical protein
MSDLLVSLDADSGLLGGSSNVFEDDQITNDATVSLASNNHGTCE